MKRMTRLIMRHLEGDAEPTLSLPTLGGAIHLERTDATLTAYGGLVAYSAFVKKLGWLDNLAARFPVEHTSPNALPVTDVLRGFELNCLCEGCRFAHVRWVQNDPAVAHVIGIRVPGKDALPRLVKSLSRAHASQWVAGTERELYAALPKEFVTDWDATVNVRYGHQEDAAIGYNPFKPGRRSHHPLICIAAGTRLCLHWPIPITQLAPALWADEHMPRFGINTHTLLSHDCTTLRRQRTRQEGNDARGIRPPGRNRDVTPTGLG